MNDYSPTAPWRNGALTSFTPCDQWWATYRIDGSEDGRPAHRTFRIKVAGWGTYNSHGRLHVVAMVASLDSGELEPVSNVPYFLRLWHDGETICDCGSSGGEITDPWWCDRCAATIQ